MTTKEFCDFVNDTRKYEHSTFASTAKYLTKCYLDEVFTRKSSQDEPDLIVKVYRLEDGFLIIMDGLEEDYSHFVENLTQAHVHIEDMIYLHSNQS